jgi:hypothetical protein
VQHQPALTGPATDLYPSITIDEAGLMLAEALQIAGTLEAAAVEYRRDGDPLPSGMLTCGEACRMASAVVGLALNLFPQLSNEEILGSVVCNAITAGATGAVQ